MSPFPLAAGGGLQFPERYRKWIEEEVVYIISPGEKEVFHKLKTDRERELFIQAFWEHRDSTPGDRDNEMFREHYRRINHADQYFGRDVPKAGWETDQGRIYVMLGEPNDIQRFEGMTQVYPCEVWFYQGLTDRGLPPAFYLIFYQDRGIGEYRLYSPLADGPQALLTSYFGDPMDYLAAYDQLREQAPELSGVSLSLIPGESAMQQGRPSLSSDLLINRIESTPMREIEDRYARKFLEYKDIVEVEYSTNYIESDSLVKISRDPSGIYFVHYAIEPERLSVNAREGRYSTTLTLNGAVSDDAGTVIHQFEKSIPLQFDGEQIKSIQSRPVSIRDMFPLIPGQYRLSVLIKNEVSKEFTSLERTLLIPGEEKKLQMTSLLLGYGMRENRPPQGRLRPFQSGRFQVRFQASRVFTSQDALVLAYQINGMESGVGLRSEIQYALFKDEVPFRELFRRPADYADLPDITESFPLQDFPPAHYTIRVTFLVDGREVLLASEEFDITHAAAVPRPWTYSKLLAEAGHPVYAFILGSQFFRSGRLEPARVQLEHAHASDPDNLMYSLELARVYLAQKNYTRIPALLSPLLGRQEPSSFEVYFTLGRAHQSLGDLSRAVEVYEQALKNVGANTMLLNSLGECLYRQGRLDEALAVWERSLEIDQKQPAIRKLVDAVKEKR
jgi:GWxTD domain-containing protein